MNSFYLKALGVGLVGSTGVAVLGAQKKRCHWLGSVAVQR